MSSVCNLAVTCKIWFLLNQTICSRAMTCVGQRGYGVQAQSHSLKHRMTGNAYLDHLTVEMEDYQHVHVMPNLPLTCHPNKHTGKVTIGVKSGLHTVRSGGFIA